MVRMGVGRGPGRLGALFLAGSLVAAAAWGEQSGSRLFPKAVPVLQGLRMRVTLPQSYYGPGEAIRAYCTLTNTGAKSVRLPPVLAFTAVLTEGGEERTFPQEECTSSASPVPASLAPGEHLVRCLGLRPGRKDLLPGEFPFRIYLRLAGKGVPTGTLVSEAVPLRVRYNVFWVN